VPRQFEPERLVQPACNDKRKTLCRNLSTANDKRALIVWISKDQRRSVFLFFLHSTFPPAAQQPEDRNKTRRKPYRTSRSTAHARSEALLRKET
jgi:hypothetical protein